MLDYEILSNRREALRKITISLHLLILNISLTASINVTGY